MDNLEKAKDAFDSGEFLRASTYLTNYITNTRADDVMLPIAYRNRGTAYGILGENDKALSDLNRAVAMKPEDNIARVNRAMVYKDIENYEESSKDCFHVLDAGQEGMAQAYYCLGEINIKFGQTKTAIDYFMRGRDEANKINDQNLVELFSDKIKNLGFRTFWDPLIGNEETKPFSIPSN